VNERLADIDEERIRFASLRGKIINKIEEIMDQADWDEETCQKVRSMIDPIKYETYPETHSTDIWAETVNQTIRLFETLFRTQKTPSIDVENEKKEEEEFEVTPD
jgi:hypothetical protein